MYKNEVLYPISMNSENNDDIILMVDIILWVRYKIVTVRYNNTCCIINYTT